MYICTIDTPLGSATAGSENGALTGFWFVGQKYYPQTAHTGIEAPDEPVFSALRLWLEKYFAGQNPKPDVTLAPKGTPFQRAIWDILVTIPYGRTATYGAVAARAAHLRGASSFSSRAVGGAVGRNPISLLIPCHRVVGANGSLTGYAGGIEKKEALLRLEGSI